MRRTWHRPEEENRNDLHRIPIKDKKAFTCDECDNICSSKQSLHRHEITHKPDKPKYFCGICNKCFSGKPSVARHLRLHSGERPFSCDICGKSFTEKFKVEIHMRIHTGEKPFQCRLCGAKFSSRSNLNSHKIVHKNEKRFVCNHCGISFGRKYNMEKHIEKNTNAKLIFYKKCDGRSIGEENFDIRVVDHEISHVNEKLDPSDKRVGDDCIVENPLNHSRSGREADEKPFSCTICKKRFHEKCILKKHMRCHSIEGRPYTCEICHKNYRRSYDLNKHSLTHGRVKTSENPFSCDLCGKSYNDKRNKELHMRIHSGVVTPPHQSKVCHKRFHSISHSAAVHGSEKPFKCVMCEKDFHQKCDIKKHLGVHVYEYPFLCKVCDCSIMKKEELMMHVGSHDDKRVAPLKSFGESLQTTQKIKVEESTDAEDSHSGLSSESRFQSETELPELKDIKYENAFIVEELIIKDEIISDEQEYPKPLVWPTNSAMEQSLEDPCH